MIGIIVHVNGKPIDSIDAVRKNPVNRRPEPGEICTYLTGNGKTIKHPYGDRLGLVRKMITAYKKELNSPQGNAEEVMRKRILNELL